MSVASVLTICALTSGSPASAQRTFDTDIIAETFGFDDSTPKSVDLADLKQGCPNRDCIQSIDDPKYVAARDASHVSDDDIVLALAWKGEHRAWPARILDHHEIVNDAIAGTPIAITWCPLCGSAVGVLRELNGQTAEFGVSGLLYNSDLVFYDRTTGTLWDQIEAQGIVGPLTGTRLELVPVTMTRWGRWKAAHPDTLILSEDTGFEKDYSEDRYAGYRQEERLVFPVSNSSDAMHPKAVVYGFELPEQTVAITEASLERESTLEATFDGREYLVRLANDGGVRMTDASSGKVYTPVRLYWFAWYTFHPDTLLQQ